MVIQRVAADDVTAGHEAYDKTQEYFASVYESVDAYTTTVLDIDNEPRDDEEHEVADKMADGYKAWAVNLYNKSQAYLYEGQKANDYTKRPKQFAILGVNTKTDADLTVHTRTDDGHTFTGWESRPVEFKASTSPNQAAVYKLAVEGLEQLKKRNDSTGRFGETFTSMVLVIHNDHPQNVFPYTEDEIARYYGGDVSQATQSDTNQRLELRLLTRVKELKFNGSVDVRLEQNGKRYAQAMFK